MQKRTRAVVRVVAGYETTTTTIGTPTPVLGTSVSDPYTRVRRSSIIWLKRCIFPGWKIINGIIGEAGCPYVMNPSFISAKWRYRELNARRLIRMVPSSPERNGGGSVLSSHVGR